MYRRECDVVVPPSRSVALIVTVKSRTCRRVVNSCANGESDGALPPAGGVRLANRTETTVIHFERKPECAFAVRRSEPTRRA